MKLKNAMKTIDVNVILTFCSDDGYVCQKVFDVQLSYEKEEKSVRELFNRGEFFDLIVQFCKECGHAPEELVKISTAANWTGNGFTYDIGNGKWSFGNWRGENAVWSDNLVQLYGFGKNDNTPACDLNSPALH